MQVSLKIQRYNPETEEQALESFTVDVNEEATLLDTLDVIKDEVDGSLTYRKSCRMAVCGSCMKSRTVAECQW